MRKAAFEGLPIPIGFASGSVPQIAANKLLVKNLTAIGLYRENYFPRWPDVRGESADRNLDRYRSIRVRPQVGRSLLLSRTDEALEAPRNRESTGKIVPCCCRLCWTEIPPNTPRPPTGVVQKNMADRTAGQPEVVKHRLVRAALKPEKDGLPGIRDMAGTDAPPPRGGQPVELGPHGSGPSIRPLPCTARRHPEPPAGLSATAPAAGSGGWAAR